ncbi:MAG TPA: response regulator transcription factor [Terriglobales bacterium]|jgi:DNA-binding NarL/FixJ family response regulator
MSVNTVLLVDDFDAWRQKVRSILREQAELDVVAEAKDGFEAVRRAEELQPDLILLDVGLPHLNGILAAVEIVKVSPSAKILFLSQNNDVDIMAAAMNTGASAYIQKSKAGTDLLPAIFTTLASEIPPARNQVPEESFHPLSL